jgi:DNA-nicking Smr family endonuclease
MTTEATLSKSLQSEEYVCFKQTGVSNKSLRKLRKGQYNVEARLDLHGLSAHQAKLAVEEFLEQCLHKNKRVVLIIHGKGRHQQAPVLKNKLDAWLREIRAVLAFCSANASQGGRGAVYVLLKHHQEEL